METTYEPCATMYSCVFKDVWDWIDWKSIIIAISLWVGAVWLAYTRGRTREVRRLWLSVRRGTGQTVIGLVLVFVGVFIFYSPYKRYNAAKNHITQLLVETKTKDKTIADLQAKLNQPPEPLKIGHYALGPIEGRLKKGATAYEYFVHTNRVITPVRLGVDCDRDIVDVHVRMLGLPPQILTSGGPERINAKQYEYGIGSPSRGPMTPLLVTIHSNQEVKCSFVQR